MDEWKEETLKMHGSITGVNLFGYGFWHKVYDQDLILIFTAFVVYGIKRIVHIIIQFLEVFFRNTAETESDIFEVKNGTEVIVQVCKRRDPGLGFL